MVPYFPKMEENHMIREVNTIVSGRKLLWWESIPMCPPNHVALGGHCWNVTFFLFEMSTSQGTVSPNLIRSARLRQRNDFHVNIWIGGLWTPPLPYLTII